MKLKQWICFLVGTFFCPLANLQASPISLPAVGYEYVQNFNTLASAGASAVLPNGWSFAEFGGIGDGTYAADNGGSSIGNTYSYGNEGLDERGLGSLNSGQFEITFGAQFQNNTGDSISLTISYLGEVWRLGTTNLLDRLDFQYSTNATSLTTGTWTDYDPLDFSDSFLAPFSPTAGQHSGNSDPFHTPVSAAISGLTILNESTFWIRWNDFDVLGGPDDGLSIDQFRLAAQPLPPSAPEPAALCLAIIAVPALFLAHRFGRRE